MSQYMTIEERRLKVAEIKRQIELLQSQLNRHQDAIDEHASKQFIQLARITRQNTAHSIGDDRPWFGDIRTFSAWLRTDPKGKDFRWCEWNGSIYNADEIRAGRMIQTPARWNDLP